MNFLLLFIKNPLLVIALVVGSILGNLIQIPSILLLPFGNSFRTYNRYVCSIYWKACVQLLAKFTFTKIEIRGDEQYKENAIIIANHQSVADIPILLHFLANKKFMEYNKWFAKDILKYFPGPGWGMVFLDNILVKRNWNKDKNAIKNTFRKIYKYKIPTWLFTFPEGTRITDLKYKKSREFAINRGLPLFQNLMVPRKKGFVASVQGLRNYVSSVYDVTICYKNGAPSTFGYLFGSGTDVILNFKRYDIDSLPQGEEELYLWLLERFREKDESLNNQCRKH